MELRRESVFAGETEGARRASAVSPAGAAGVPDPAVDAKAKRRRFTAEYKVRILREVDRAKAPGEVGAILRREGLYSSHLSVWRRDRDRVAKTDLVARKRGPKPKAVDPKIKQLERENAKLRRRNERVELMLEIQKNLRGARRAILLDQKLREGVFCVPTEGSGRQLFGGLTP